MAEVIKDWDAFEHVAVPLTGALPVKGLKRGRQVSAGEVLALNPDPRTGDIHAAVNGMVEEINEKAIVIKRDDQAVGEPPQPVDLKHSPPEALAAGLKKLGLNPPRLSRDDTLIISTQDAEPGLALSPALFDEHRETVLAGAETLECLLERKAVWAVRRATQAPDGSRTVLVSDRFPYALPALIKKQITGHNDPQGAGVFGGRELFLLGRVRRTGLPLTKLPLTLGGANYFVPVGSRIIDLLTFANLSPDSGDVVISGGFVHGHSLTRLESGLGKSAAAVHLIRRADLGGPPRNCRSCGECRRACPLKLPVDLIANGDPTQWLENRWPSFMNDCLLCGACAAACPSSRPLMSLIHLLPQAAWSQAD